MRKKLKAADQIAAAPVGASTGDWSRAKRIELRPLRLVVLSVGPAIVVASSVSCVRQ